MFSSGNVTYFTHFEALTADSIRLMLLIQPKRKPGRKMWQKRHAENGPVPDLIKDFDPGNALNDTSADRMGTLPKASCILLGVVSI